MNADRFQERLDATRDSEHSGCVICGWANALGLNLSFRARPDGSVEGSFYCGNSFQGYPGVLHGGLIASLLDGAMINCLFARGKVALTRELTVRFLRPVATNVSATVKAWMRRSLDPLHVLDAELAQNGKVLASATGKFMERPKAALPCRPNGPASASEAGEISVNG